MGLIIGRESYAFCNSCGKCGSKSFDQNVAMVLAGKEGWLYNDNNGHMFCPECRMRANLPPENLHRLICGVISALNSAARAKKFSHLYVTQDHIEEATKHLKYTQAWPMIKSEV